MPAKGSPRSRSAGRRTGSGEEQAGAAVADVDTIVALDASRRRRQRLSRLADQLPECLVQADDGTLRVTRAVVDLQHILRVADELGRPRRRDAPSPPGA